jgi:hypothetical protein
VRLETELPETTNCAPDRAYWRRHVDWGRPDDLIAVVNLQNEVLEAASRGGDARFEQVCAAALRDVQALASREPIVSQALKLVLGADVARFWNGRGDASRAWDWTATAVGVVHEHPRSMTYDWTLPRQLLSTHSTALVAAHGYIALAETLYYLAWSRGYLPELAEDLAPTVSSLLPAALNAPGASVVAAGHFASWLRSNGREDDARRLVLLLENMLYSNPSGPDSGILTNLLASGLATCSTRGAAEHLAWALENVREPDPLVRLGWLSGVAQAGREAVVERYGDVRSTVAEAADVLHSSSVDRVRKSFVLMQQFKALSPVVSTLLLDGDTGRALDLMALWANVSDDRATDTALFIFEDSSGVRVTRPQHPAVLTSTEGRVLMQRTSNLALGMALVDANEPASPTAPASGELQPAFGSEFAHAVETYVGLAALADVVQESASTGQVPPLVNLLSGHLPVQALLARQGAPVPPLLASFTQPVADRPINRIQFWAGDAPGAAEELAMVRSILSATATVDAVEGLRVTRDHFITAYANDEYDVIWVASHADRDPYDPEHAGLTLNDGERVSLYDLAATHRPTDERRRLIVLNGCGTGAVSALGPLSMLGLAHVLAREDQAVVANLWPVGSVGARVFAASLACGLAQFPAYTEAFEWALQTYVKEPRQAWTALQGWDDSGGVVTALHEYSPTPLTWGAPALFV